MDQRIVLILLIAFGAAKTDATVTAYSSKDNGTSESFDDMEARFGPGLGSDGLDGLLMRGDPYNGCKTLKDPPSDNGSLYIFKFVLITRGDCDFAIKALNAQKAGYQAVIIHNVGSNQLLAMSSGDPEIARRIDIPALFIGEDSGRRLNSTYLYNDIGTPYVKLKADQFNPLDYYLIPFVIVIGVCFVSLLCFLLCKCYRDRRRVRRGRLSLQRLKKLPVKKFAKTDEYDVCAICLEDYEEGDSLRILPCNHAYHCKCVDPWLTSNKRVCPLCKRRVLSDDETSSSSDDDSSDDENTPLVPASDAASPNASRYGTGYASRNPFRNLRRSFRRRLSVSSTDTESTDVSDTNLIPETRVVSSNHQTSAYQSQELTPSQVLVDEAIHTHPHGNTLETDADTYLDSAEAMMTHRSRVSESSIAVLSDDEPEEISPEPLSYTSRDFHSAIESDAPTPYDMDSRFDVANDLNQEDIIVLASGSKTVLQEEEEV